LENSEDAVPERSPIYMKIVEAYVYSEMLQLFLNLMMKGEYFAVIAVKKALKIWIKFVINFDHH
jgi:hypothetical protein